MHVAKLWGECNLMGAVDSSCCECIIPEQTGMDAAVHCPSTSQVLVRGMDRLYPGLQPYVTLCPSVVPFVVYLT